MKTEKPMLGFKGFDKNLVCNGKKYGVGKSFEHEGDIKLCEKGFHFCENPIDVWGYYGPGDSRFCEVEASDVSDEKSNDSKRVCKRITVKTELSLKAMVDLAVKFVFEKVDWKNAKVSNTGNQSAATNTGDYSAATNSGYQSAATNTGNRSAATNTGNYSAATNTGNYSAATNTGNYSAATNTGDYSAATNTGDRSAATNTGYQSAATNTGNRSAATNTGDYSAATNTGYQSAATNTGNRSAATNTGDRSAATNTGDYSAATNTGDRSAATVEGKDSIACGLGYKNKASGKKGCWLVLVERNDSYEIMSVKTAKVCGKKIKEDTFYTLENGEFKEVK